LKRFDWLFIEIALGYLAKAFFTRDTFEALFWNICAIEAVLGGEKRSKVDIKFSLGQLLGSIKEPRKRIEERKRIKKLFDEIYDYRNVLVHAAHYNGSMQGIHVNEARNFARRTIVWFIDQMSKVYAQKSSCGVPDDEFPRKNDFIKMIDQMN